MAGLLDQIQQAQTAQTRGLLSHVPAQRVTGRQVADAAQAVGLLTAPIPVVGDVMGLLGDAAMYATKPEERTAGNMALTALGVLPFFPALAGRLGKAGKLLDVTDKNTYKAVREAMGGKVTEAEVRQAIAQYNAALPKASGGLGLGEANTAMERAGLLGYNTPAFHGTNRNFSGFSDNALGVNTGAKSAEKAHFFSKGPHTANSYVKFGGMFNDQAPAYETLLKNPEAWAKFNATNDNLERWKVLEQYGLNQGSGRMLPVQLNMGKSLVQDYGGTGYRDVSYNEVLKRAKKNRKDSVVFQNTTDPGGEFNFGNVSRDDIYAVFDPSRVRSRFAAFDPAQRQSRNLLASMAGVGLLSPAFFMGDESGQ